MSTIITIQSTDAIANSRADINANFANLNADKIESLSDLGITATSTELNYCDGVTSNIQTQLNTKDTYITGEVRWVAFGEGNIPSGWLICDGSAVSRTTYATLFTAIGTTYGVGNGSTTFNVPDLRGRIVGGKDDMGGSAANRITNASADSLGGTYGTETHTLAVGEIPSHTHGLIINSGGAGSNVNVGTSTSASSQYDTTWGSGSSTATDGGTGGGGAHNNVQPTIFLNAIIRT